MFTPTKGQAECIDIATKFYLKDEDEDFVYAGPAGTGKTSIAPLIVKNMGLEPDEVLFVSFTGKAASILMIKGFNASTIHSAFFELSRVPVYEDGRPLYKNGRMVTKFAFVERDYIDSRIKLIWIEEWGMVNEELKKVIYKFGIPVIASGDEHQLPPIFGESPFAKRIKYRLWEITRQAEGNGIIQLATLLRQGEDFGTYRNFNNDAYVLSKKFIKKRHLNEADIILTARNKTRNMFNDKMRDLHGSYGKLPNVGDKLVCRKNNWSKSLNGIPLINGTIGKVVNPIIRSECNLERGIYRIDFRPDYITDYNCYEALPCDYDFLTQPCGNKEINKYNVGAKMEFGEAITVHLAQGSQYPNVVYWDEWIGDREYMQKLRYTAVTRAIEKAYMFI